MKGSASCPPSRAGMDRHVIGEHKPAHPIWLAVVRHVGRQNTPDASECHAREGAAQGLEDLWWLARGEQSRSSYVTSSAVTATLLMSSDGLDALSDDPLPTAVAAPA